MIDYAQTASTRMPEYADQCIISDDQSFAVDRATEQRVFIRKKKRRDDEVLASTTPILKISDASTEMAPHLPLLSSEFTNLFRDAVDCDFEDGMENVFSKRLIMLVRKHGEQAVKDLSGVIQSKDTNPEIAAEALRWIGQMYHPKTYEYRFWLLTNSLTSVSARVRDGALLGLAYVDSVKAVPYLEKAFERETCDGLREDIQQVLTDLRSRDGGKVSTHSS